MLRGPEERRLQSSQHCTRVLYGTLLRCAVLCCAVCMYVQQTQGERDEPDQSRAFDTDQARGLTKSSSKGMVDTGQGASELVGILNRYPNQDEAGNWGTCILTEF